MAPRSASRKQRTDGSVDIFPDCDIGIFGAEHEADAKADNRGANSKRRLAWVSVACGGDCF